MISALLISAVLAFFTLLSFRNQKLGISILFALLPTYLVRFSIGSIPTTLLECLILVTIGVAMFRTTQPSSVKLQWASHILPAIWESFGWYRIPLALLLIASIVSTIVAPNLFSALGILKAYAIEPILLAVVIKSVMTDRKDIENIIASLIGSGAFIGLLAILQALTRIGIPDAWAIENRATSLYDYPNAVGLFLAPIVVMGVVRLLGSIQTPSHQSPLLLPHKWGRAAAPLFIAILLMLGGIVAAKTEAALVAIPIALVVTALVALPPFMGGAGGGLRRIKAGIVTASILGALIIGALAPSIVQKISLHDSSGLVRRAQWSETLTMLADHPFLGVGLNGYSTALIPYHDATFYEIFQYPHNILLNIWSELGIIGIIAFFIGVFLLVRTTWRRRNDILILAFSAALLTMMIHGLVDVPFFKNDLAILTMFCVVGMMTKKATRNQE